MVGKTAKPKVEDAVRQIAEPICQEFNCGIFDVEYKKEGADWYLRLFIDREEPVDHELCHKVSQRLSDALDIYDPIPNAYFLEVSSPGIERVLKTLDDFEKYRSKLVAIKLFAPHNGKKDFSGYLLGIKDGLVSIEVKEKDKTAVYALAYDTIANAHLLFDFTN